MSRLEEKPGFPEFAARTGILLVLQFGSTVKGVRHSLNDVDIAVQFDRAEVSLQILFAVSRELETVFSGQKVDMAVINRADPLFLKQILDRCVQLFGRPQDLARLRLYAFKRYQDYRRFLEIERRFVADYLMALRDGMRDSA